MIKVLLVCGSRFMGDRLEVRLSKIAGVTIIGQLDNADDAIRRIEAEVPTVVVVDIHLTGGRGMEVLRKVIRLEVPPFIVAVSDSAQRQYYLQSLKEGAACCIRLPDQIDTLTELLEGMVSP